MNKKFIIFLTSVLVGGGLIATNGSWYQVLTNIFQYIK